MDRGHYPRADLSGLRGAAPWYVARLGADDYWHCGISRNHGGEGGKPERYGLDDRCNWLRFVWNGSWLCENADDTLSGATFESAVARF